jgi:hypothetical protein
MFPVMPRTRLRNFRRFAPAVLAASLGFVALGDARTNCLAAWLCAPPARADCMHGAVPAAAWQPGSEVCEFGAELQRAELRTDGKRLELPGPGPAHPLASLALVPASGTSSSGHDGGGPPGTSPPLYRLHASLLI